MKKLITITLLLALASSLSANALDFSKIGYSINGGVNLTNISDIDNSDSLLGFSVGGRASLPMDDQLSISADLNFSQAGTKTSVTSGSTTTETEIRRNYITVPVNLNYNVTEQASLNFGPYVGYLLNANQIKKEGSNASVETDIKSSTRTLDYGIQLGASTQIEQFTISGQYVLGLNKTTAESVTAEQKNSGFTFTTGYNF